MAKFTATIDEKSMDAIRLKFKKLKRGITKEEADRMGKDVIAEMKSLISTGVSPIKGNGKFPAYLNPDKYPGKRKSKTPVNLKLSGAFLKNLKSKVVKRGVSIGYRNSKQQQKERGHREGAKGQPERPTIPRGTEQFAQRIQDVYLRFLLKIQRKIAKRRN